MKEKGIYLTWQDISASIGDKQILNNITGVATPGSTFAIMGPSGAGKTTLLSILAKKIDSQMNVTGKVLANQKEYNSNTFYEFASFVFQNDILNEPLTVRETLEFTAFLKIKDRNEAQQRVNEMISKFLLQKCEDTKVGGKMIKGISGGEKKRLCIAIQVIAKPDLLILDEPTSGLDSFMANSVLQILDRLAKEDGKTIIYTIHQPSYKMYSMLNKLILLDKGQCIYQGQASAIAEYMLSLKIQIPTKTTICDFFMFQISEYKQRTLKYQTPLTEKSYNQCLHKNICQQLQKVNKSMEMPEIQKKTALQGFKTQLDILFGREIKLSFRNKTKVGRGIAMSILMTIIIGLIFKSAISDNRPLIDKIYQEFPLILYFANAQGVSFICVTSIIMTGLNSVILVFPTEREVFAKETSSKTYNTLPYFISKLFFELLNIWMIAILFSSGVYWILGYKTSLMCFLRFLFAQCSIAMVGSSIGLLTGSFFKDVRKASAMAPAFLLPLMIFSGLYNTISAIPAWIRWMQYISPFRYGLHALLLNEYENEKYFMANGQIFDYRAQYSVNLDYSQNIIILLCLSGLYYSLSYICLRGLSAKLAA